VGFDDEVGARVTQEPDGSRERLGLPSIDIDFNKSGHESIRVGSVVQCNKAARRRALSSHSAFAQVQMLRQRRVRGEGLTKCRDQPWVRFEGHDGRAREPSQHKRVVADLRADIKRSESRETQGSNVPVQLEFI